MKTITALAIVFFLLLGIGTQIMAANENLIKADEIFKSRKYQEALKLYEQVAVSANKSGEVSDEIEALSQIARCHLLDRKKDECAEWLSKAEKLANKKYPLGWSRYLGVRGRLEWQNDDLESSRTTFMEMFNFCDNEKLDERAIDAAHMIGIVGTQEQQIEWGLKGIKLAEERNVKSWLGPLWNNLAITHSDMKNWGDCVAAFKKAREFHWQYGNETNKLYADYHIGWSLKMMGEAEEALTWLRPSLAWAERLGEDNCIGQACEDLADIAAGKNENKQALELYKRALASYDKIGMQEWSKDIYDKLKEKIAKLEK